MPMPDVPCAVTSPALRFPPVIAEIGCRLVDASREQIAEQAIAGLVRVAPVARPVKRYVGGSLAPRRARIDESDVMGERHGTDALADLLALRVDLGDRKFAARSQMRMADARLVVRIVVLRRHHVRSRIAVDRARRGYVHERDRHTGKALLKPCERAVVDQ